MQKGLEAQGNPELNNIREREKKKRCPQLQSFYQQRPERERKKKVKMTISLTCLLFFQTLTVTIYPNFLKSTINQK